MKSDFSLYASPTNTPQIKLSEFVEIIGKHLETLQKHYPGIYVANRVIMPNHIHMIFCMDENMAKRQDDFYYQ